MENKQSSSHGLVCHQLPTLSEKYPLFVSQNLGAKDHYFYTLHDLHYQCQIPELLGRRIQGYFHGWVILSDQLQNLWSLWNPITSHMIRLPRLSIKDVDPESIQDCCLSAPPEDPISVLLLTRSTKPSFVFCRLDRKKKKSRWIQMSYLNKLKKIVGDEADFLHKLTCCNGKLYALSKSLFASFIIIVDLSLAGQGKEVVVDLSLFGAFPTPTLLHCEKVTYFLKGYDTQLFCILIGFREKVLERAHVMKLDMSCVSENMKRFGGLDMSCNKWEEEDNFDDICKSTELWEELVDLENAIFFVDLVGDSMAYYRSGIASELGGYIHIRDKRKNILYSYQVKDKTISLSYMPPLVLPTSSVSLWECRYKDDHGGAKCTLLDSKQEKSQIAERSVTNDEVGLHEWNLLDLPFDILETIMGHCVSIEYLNFRATCNSCKEAAPLKQWGKKTSQMRLPTYSVASPWLMVVNKCEGIICFTDWISGDKYFMEDPSIPEEIYCSRFGWLFFFRIDLDCSVLYNPFTCELLKLPVTNHRVNAGCLSGPPTSPDCIVAGFSSHDECLVLIYHVARGSEWREIRVGHQPISIHFLEFYGQDLYALDGDGILIVLEDLGKADDSPAAVQTIATDRCFISPTRDYLMKWDKDLIKVIVGKFGEPVEVFKWDVIKDGWEKKDSLGNHTIYVCGSTCLCIEAKTQEMENKICFPILHSKDRKMVFYSLETCTYQTYNGKKIKDNLRDFFGTTHQALPTLWIEPSWA